MSAPLLYPVPVNTPITQHYGENPGNYSRWGLMAHNGLDFGAVGGTLVTSASAGRVVRTAYDATGYGNYVQVETPDGLQIVYAHLQLILALTGAAVIPGQELGRVGSTGNSTGPHLHFEVRMPGMERNGYGGAIDPLPLLATPMTIQPVGEIEEGYIRVAADAINVRVAPGLKEAAVGQAKWGQLLRQEGQGRVVDGITWLPVILWVAQSYQGEALVEVHDATSE